MTADRLIAGRYRLSDPIGTGAMGVVWKATDVRLQRTVAVKQLRLDAGLTPSQRVEARARAMREGRIAARLHHPNAITVFDVAEEDGRPWLVMEFMDAPSLAARISGGRTLPSAEVARIGAQAAAALAAAHDAGILHRDVKPANLLVADDGTVKITDFGISRAVGDVTVTATGFLAGTPAYLAPEVARGENGEPASDVFALGSTLYAAVTGHPPFGEGDNPLAVLHAVARGHVEPPRHAGALGPVLMHLLAPAPGARPTMREAKAALEAVAAGRVPGAGHTTVLPPGGYPRTAVLAGPGGTTVFPEPGPQPYGAPGTPPPADPRGARGTPPPAAFRGGYPPAPPQRGVPGGFAPGRSFPDPARPAVAPGTPVPGAARPGVAGSGPHGGDPAVPGAGSSASGGGVPAPDAVRPGGSGPRGGPSAPGPGSPGRSASGGGSGSGSAGAPVREPAAPEPEGGPSSPAEVDLREREAAGAAALGAAAAAAAGRGDGSETSGEADAEASDAATAADDAGEGSASTPAGGASAASGDDAAARPEAASGSGAADSSGAAEATDFDAGTPGAGESGSHPGAGSGTSGAAETGRGAETPGPTGRDSSATAAPAAASTPSGEATTPNDRAAATPNDRTPAASSDDAITADDRTPAATSGDATTAYDRSPTATSGDVTTADDRTPAASAFAGPATFPPSDDRTTRFAGAPGATPYTPAPPRRDPAGGKRLQLAALAAITVAVVVLAGVLVTLVARGGGEEEPSAAPPPSAVPSLDTSAPEPPPTTPPASAAPAPATSHAAAPQEGPPTPEQMAQFVQGYYGRLPGDVNGAWAQLSPGYQAQTGGFGAYTQFWSTIRGVRVGAVNPTGPDTVVANLTYTLAGGSVSSESRWFRVTNEGGRLVISGSGV